jgi:hypothetical protein
LAAAAGRRGNGDQRGAHQVGGGACRRRSIILSCNAMVEKMAPSLSVVVVLLLPATTPCPIPSCSYSPACLVDRDRTSHPNTPTRHDAHTHTPTPTPTSTPTPTHRPDPHDTPRHTHTTLSSLGHAVPGGWLQLRLPQVPALLPHALPLRPHLGPPPLLQRR